MKKVLFAAALLAAFSIPANATTCPAFTYGYVLTAAQWQACFDAKQNALGYDPVNKAGDVMTGRLVMPGSTGSRASFNLTPGAVPTSPVDGDLWTTASGIYARANGVTLQLFSPDITNITGLGTGVATALGKNIGTSGAVVLNGGALGTPSSGVATNLTGTAAGLTAGSATNAVASLNGQIGTVVHNVDRRVRGMTGSRNSGTATRLDLAADAVTFVNPTTNLAVVVSAITSKACDIATAGPAAGGRDQAGAFSSNATVNFFWIAQDGGASPALIASTASFTTGPTLPSGYTMWAPATTMVMNGSNLQIVSVRGNNVYYQAQQQVLNSGVATIETAVPISSVVPAGAMSFNIYGDINNASAGTGNQNVAIRFISGTTFMNVNVGIQVAAASAFSYYSATVPNVSQNLYYLNSAATVRADIWVLSYTVPN